MRKKIVAMMMAAALVVDVYKRQDILITITVQERM